MKYICVEGCIGVGKTTVATQLSKAISGSVNLLEDFSSHPFLDDFYADEKYTFETEMNFILIHYHQLIKAMASDPQLLIGDYFFDRDKLFADANILSETEMSIFMQLYDYLRTRIVRPDVIVCLSGTTDMICERIATRNREAEKNISYEYIDKINMYYEKFFSECRKSYHTIDVDMNTSDFIKSPSLINGLTEHICSTIAISKNYKGNHIRPVR
ncbi:deoxyguanosine kinase [Planctomycetales bacterium]|nr:deoxyguanosine kinase [Planctomycetales bacterium]GHT01845.1 deoxyguanosine kinase [Planctomycetales bacterium]